MTLFQMMIVGGAAVTLMGFALLIFCIARVWRARRAGLPDDEMRETLRQVLPLNMGALGISVLGLMLVVLGIAFG